MTNRLGDLLMDLRNPNLSQMRLNEIQRIFNELDDRDQSYRSWLQLQNRQPQLTNPTLGSPRWLNSPLHAYTFYMQTDLTVPNATDKYINHDAARTFGNEFETYPDSNGSRVRRGSAVGNAFSPFTVNGFAIWAANATGYRAGWIESFDKGNNFLRRTPLHTAAGHNLIDNVLPFSLTWFFEPDTDYIKFKVHQTSGGNLTLTEFYAGFTLA